MLAAGLLSATAVQAQAPLQFTEIDYATRATAALSTTNFPTLADLQPAFGFQQSDQTELALERSVHARVAPDGSSFADGFMDVTAHSGGAIVGVGAVGNASATVASQPVLFDMYQASAGSEARWSAIWRDRVTIDVPGRAPGAAFTETATLALDGFSSFAAAVGVQDGACLGRGLMPPSVDYQAGLQVSGTGVPLPPTSQHGNYGFWSGGWRNGQLVADTDIATPSEIQWTQSLYNGQTVDLFVEMTVTMQGEVGNLLGCNAHPASAALAYALNYQHTLSWGGITSITDGLGLPVTDFTLTSLSGVDYRLAAVPPSPPASGVPEPTMAWLLAIAGVALLAATRGPHRGRPG